MTQSGLRIADTEIPPLKPGEVRIAVRHVGISTSDLIMWRGDAEVPLPLVPGHEVAGIVDESTDPSQSAGEFVTVNMDISCGTCYYCRRNLSDMCVRRKRIGIDVDGAMAEYVVVPSENVRRLPERVSSDAAVFAVPLASVIALVSRLAMSDGQKVLVIGANTVGLLAAQVCEARGADVIVASPSIRQIGLARQLGFINTVNTPLSECAETVRGVVGQHGCEIVLESTGTPAGISAALDAVSMRGHVGLVHEDLMKVQISSLPILDKEIHVTAARHGPLEPAIEMINRGRIEVKRLIGSVFPLEKGNEAFEYADRTDSHKVVIVV